MMSIAFIALGANLGEPLKQADEAISMIRQLPITTILKRSPCYRSKPLGPTDQPDYLNMVLKISTNLIPEKLLSELQNIEIVLGRVRKNHRWGARTLDLDILLFDNQIIMTQRLTIPHYDMKNREFVLYPLFDIEPTLVLPDQTRLDSLIKTVPRNGMTYW